MGRYVVLAINGPVAPDRDAAFNAWYDTVHIPDLAAVDGVVTTQRYKVVQGNGTDLPYVAVYTIETDDLPTVMRDMATTPRPADASFDRANSKFILLEAIAPDAG